MNALFLHIFVGLAVYPVSLFYWYLYWYIQPSDSNSLKLGYDVVTSRPISKTAYRIKYIGFVGSCILAALWVFIGNYYAKLPILGTNLLALFNWSESTFYGYLYFWFCVVSGMIYLAWHSAKVLVWKKKWHDDIRRLY